MNEMAHSDIERILRTVLAPVDPPIHLQRRVENTLDSVLELAADELESWELVAIKDPRNWPRAAVGPATAIVVGSGAAVGLVVLRTQRKRRSMSSNVEPGSDITGVRLRSCRPALCPRAGGSHGAATPW